MPPGWAGGRGVLRTGHLAATRRPAAAAGHDPDTERVMVTEFEKTLGAHGVDRRAGWAIRGSAQLPWVDRHNCFSAATSFSSSPLCASQVRASRSSTRSRDRPASRSRRAASHTCGGSPSHSCWAAVRGLHVSGRGLTAARLLHGFAGAGGWVERCVPVTTSRRAMPTLPPASCCSGGAGPGRRRMAW